MNDSTVLEYNKFWATSPHTAKYLNDLACKWKSHVWWNCITVAVTYFSDENSTSYGKHVFNDLASLRPLLTVVHKIRNRTAYEP